MRIFAILLSLCLTMNVLAASGTVSELERAIDEYQYAVTVEWDQKDASFHEEATEAFLEKLETMMIQGGLSKETLFGVAEKKMKDKNAFEMLKLKVSLLGKVESPAELSKILRENSKDFYQSGASWIGDMDPFTIGIVIIVVLYLASSLQSDTGSGSSNSGTYQCVAYEDVFECSSYTYPGSSYTDTTCKWVSQCSDYVIVPK